MALQFIPNAQRSKLASMELPGNNGFMSDLLTSNNKMNPMTCGFFRMEKGDPLTYAYGFDEMKLVVEGEIEIMDEEGKIEKGHPGDIFCFTKGSKITFSTDSFGVLFYCALREII